MMSADLCDICLATMAGDIDEIVRKRPYSISMASAIDIYLLAYERGKQEASGLADAEAV